MRLTDGECRNIFGVLWYRAISASGDRFRIRAFSSNARIALEAFVTLAHAAVTPNTESRVL